MTISLLTLSLGGQLASTNGVLMAAHTSAVQVTSAVFTNVSNGQRQITIYIVRSGGTAGPANILIDAQTIGVGQTYNACELKGRNLAAGDVITGFADTAAAVNCVIDGFSL
jgi:hypothetical protein